MNSIHLGQCWLLNIDLGLLASANQLIEDSKQGEITHVITFLFGPSPYGTRAAHSTTTVIKEEKNLLVVHQHYMT